MKTLKNTLFAVLTILSTAAFAQDYTANIEKSSLKWIGKKVTGEHYGTIMLNTGSFTIKGNKIAKGEFVINMTSITVDDLEGEWKDKLTGHLNSDDFFGTANYPTAKLVVSESSKFSDGVATVKGALSIKGQTHPVSFSVKQNGTTFNATVVVDRTLYDIRYGSGKFFDDLGDNMIDDEFTLEVKLVTE